MDINTAITTRRSIRKYSGEPVSEDQIKEIIRAGCYAPSAHNKQPWRFVVIREKETLEKLTKFHPYAKMVPTAGCVIVVCGDKEEQHQMGFLVEDCSAAIQNMLLTATGLGLGSVWCGVYPVPQLVMPLSQILNLPATVEPIGMVVVGHKDEDRQTEERYCEDKVHWGKW